MLELQILITWFHMVQMNQFKSHDISKGNLIDYTTDCSIQYITIWYNIWQSKIYKILSEQPCSSQWYCHCMYICYYITLLCINMYTYVYHERYSYRLHRITIYPTWILNYNTNCLISINCFHIIFVNYIKKAPISHNYIHL